MNLQTTVKGVLVQQVDTGSPADQAGLLGSLTTATIGGKSVMVGGDIILALGGQPVTSIDDLKALLDQAQPGQIVTLTVMRDGRQGRVRVMLDQQPTSDMQTSSLIVL